VFTYHRDDIGDTMVWEDDPDSGIIIATRDRPRIVRYLEI
jgi:hypothetical protein